MLRVQVWCQLMQRPAAVNAAPSVVQVVKILKGRYPPVPTKYSSPLRNIVDSMLKQNPKVRWGVCVCVCV